MDPARTTPRAALYSSAAAKASDSSSSRSTSAVCWPSSGAVVSGESGYERAAVAPLRGRARRLRDSPLLNEALGGAVRVEIEKPLTPIQVRGGPGLPDFRVTVVRPGAPEGLPGGPGHPDNRAAFDPRDRARYVVEAMGRNDPEYDKRKERTHARMARLGHVFRIEARDFEAGSDSLERRCRDIAGEIERDLV